MKIATDFSKIHGNLAFFGFYVGSLMQFLFHLGVLYLTIRLLIQEWFNSMTFDVTNYNEFDGLYYEIWQRYTKEVSNVH